MSLVTQLLNLDGSTRLDLSPATSFRRVRVDLPGEEVERVSTRSPVVDGTWDVATTDPGGSAVLVLRVVGADWPIVEGRVEALSAALAEPFLLRVGVSGVLRTWRARRPTLRGTFDRTDILAIRRVVTLEIPCQPHPTVTGTTP